MVNTDHGSGGVAKTPSPHQKKTNPKKLQRETEGGGEELMNPQTAVHAAPAAAAVRGWDLSSKTNKNKWINTHCASAGACTCVCLACRCFFLCAYVCLLFMCFSSTDASGVISRCVGASLELKVDFCYSTTRWQNAATLQTEPMLGWPRYCPSSSSHITQCVWHPVSPAWCGSAERGFCSAGT